jgi:hypothetical protein
MWRGKRVERELCPSVSLNTSAGMMYPSRAFASFKELSTSIFASSRKAVEASTMVLTRGCCSVAALQTSLLVTGGFLMSASERERLIHLPSGSPIIVCLCGSTRFKQEFIAANFRETMAGRIVLSVGLYSHADAVTYAPTEEEKRALDQLHLRKIDLADEVLVLDAITLVCSLCNKPCKTVKSRQTEWGQSLCCGEDCSEKPYIGESTRNEIAYALNHGKRVRYLSREKPNG